MSAGLFAIIILVTLLSVAVVPLRSAFRKGQLYFSDLALPLLPAVCFAFALLQFNSPAQTGWALIGYPFLVVAMSVVVLYISVFGLRTLFVQARIVSFAVLAVSSAMAVYAGAIVAPWYE